MLSFCVVVCNRAACALLACLICGRLSGIVSGSHDLYNSFIASMISSASLEDACSALGKFVGCVVECSLSALC